MKTRRKVHAWLREVVQLFRGTWSGLVYSTPPSHYLEYSVDGKVPVILLPGILGKWGYMKRLGDTISLYGHPVHIVPELGINVYSIPTSAQMVRAIIVHAIPALGHITPKIPHGAEIIRKYIEKWNLKGVVIVAHSKGGLIGKYLLAHHNADHRVLGVVAIATPFSGSALAKLVPHHAFSELENDSQIIHDLEGHTKLNDRIISIFPSYDVAIWSDTGSYLEGAAENIEVPVVGHNAILYDREIIKEAVEAVETLTRRA